MPFLDSGARLRHMLEHAKEACNMVSQKTRHDLDVDRQLNLSLVRLLEVVGEAAARVSQEDRERLAEIPWKDIVSLRNRLIHGYESVDFDILWTIVKSDLPLLVVSLEKVLEGKDTSVH